MKNMNKLVALLLAAVMVLGLIPTTTAHAHEYHTHGVEEYPVIALDTPTTVEVSEGGYIAYFAFTPEVTDQYHFYSSTDFGYCDPFATLYDAEMNLLTTSDDAYYGNAMGISSPNFCIDWVMEAGVTYVLAARLYSTGATGSFNVTLHNGHSYSSAVTKEPTCTEDGVMTYTCSYCGESYEEAIPAAHTWGEDGVCTACGEVYLIEGVCGDDLTWTLDWFGKLTISGTGDMYDFFYSWEENTASEWYTDYNYDIKSVVIEEGCTSIGNYAFYQCNNMSEVSFADSVVEIGEHAFDNTALVSVVVPDTVTTLGEGAFASNYNLASATLPSGLLTIPASCFEYCGALTEVVWPANATAVNAKAFYNCSLGDLVLPEGIAFIGQSAFGGNSAMTRLTLPSTLAVLDDYAMSSCWSVTDFIFTGNAPTMAAQTFNYAMSNVWYPADNSTWTEDVMQQYGGTLTWKSMCATHAFSEWTTVEATCEVGAYQTRTCAACGWLERTEAGEPLGHDFVYTVIEPNCATYEYGRTEITCTRCDYYSSENWIWPEHQYETVVTAPTCTTDGYTTYTCTVCGSNYTDNYVAAAGHVVDAWSEPSEASCTEASIKTGTCSVCNETVTEEVSPALGHTWGEEGVENEDGSVTYTCTVCGDTYRTEGSYLYLGDNDFTITGGSGRTTKTFTAENDGILTITLNNMVYHNTWAYDNGYTDQWWQTLGAEWVFGEGWFNVYINDTNTAYTAVSEAELVFNTIDVKAGDVVTVEINHLESSGYHSNDVMFNLNLALEVEEPIDPNDPWGKSKWTKIDVDTETEDPSGTGTEGEFEYSWDNNEGTIWHSDWKNGKDVLTGENTISGSINFNKVYTINQFSFLPRQDYTYWENGSGVVLQASLYKGTLNDDGSFTWEPLAEHVEFAHNQEKKTIYFDTQDVQYVKFVAEKSSYMAENEGWVAVAEFDINYEEVVEHEHSWSEWTTTVEATCTTAGEETRSCECGETETREVAALGHDYVATEVVDPTCTKTGYTVYTCTRCSASYKDDPIEPTHTWDEGTVTAPTCTELGYTTYKCTICEFEYVDEASWTDALGHDFVNGDCTRCDAVKDAPFVDVPAGVFYFDPVEWAVEQGITTGSDDTHFNPTGNCLRAQVVTFLWRAMGKPEPTTTENPFSDVSESDWYYKAVLWAVEEGITNGLTSTTFGPNAECNRAQVVTFLWRAMGEPKPTSSENPFSDVVATAWYGNAVLWAVENDITNGMGDGTFGINGLCNRAQVVTFLYRTLAE